MPQNSGQRLSAGLAAVMACATAMTGHAQVPLAVDETAVAVRVAAYTTRLSKAPTCLVAVAADRRGYVEDLRTPIPAHKALVPNQPNKEYAEDARVLFNYKSREDPQNSLLDLSEIKKEFPQSRQDSTAECVVSVRVSKPIIVKDKAFLSGDKSNGCVSEGFRVSLSRKDRTWSVLHYEIAEYITSAPGCKPSVSSFWLAHGTPAILLLR